MSKANDVIKSFNEAYVDVSKIIKDLINTNFSGSNEEQGKAAAMFKGLAFSDDPQANKFMKEVDKAISAMDAKDYE